MALAKFGEYGLIGLIIAVLLFFIWKFSVWIMEWIKEQSIQHAQEREAWLKIVEKMNETWNNHTSQAKQFHDMVTEAHKYQREEHKEMITSLGRINGHKK